MSTVLFNNHGTQMIVRGGTTYNENQITSGRVVYDHLAKAVFANRNQYPVEITDEEWQEMTDGETNFRFYGEAPDAIIDRVMNAVN